ncbi:RidA family protein [Terrarubrum flagellatum]|uniref:RidA family protein n=1 Tax=Terrirubrum flagellatum TaxID=2895980 RepID=UPI00314508A0
MQLARFNAPDAPAPAGGYAQAVRVDGASRLLFISGQIPVGADSEVPETFQAQAALAWKNVEAQLRAAGMSFDNLVKVTIFLSDRKYAMANREARKAALGDRAFAMTVVIAGIFDQAWLLEIEAVAAA